MLLDTKKTGEHSDSTTAPLSETTASVSRPEFFRLPKTGGDPYFGLGRSYYYAGEQRGFWRLVRIRARGKRRGITLIPFDAVAAFVRKQSEAAKNG